MSLLPARAAMRRFLPVLLALALLTPPAALAAPQRMRVEALEYPWSAVGRLNVGGRVWCSAVLVSERQILTAAHCLWNQARQEWWPPGSVHFVAGAQGGEAAMHALVKSYVIADGNQRQPPPGIDANAADWALAELAEPLGRQAGWLSIGSLAGQPGPIGQLGYRADSAHAMTLDYGCGIVGLGDQGRLLWEDCASMPGNSGGPLVVFRPDGPQVVGITIATATSPAHVVTLAVSALVLGDLRHFPVAAAAARLAGLGKAAPPPAGGAIPALPLATLTALGKQDGTPPSMALLADLLARHAAAPP